MKTSSRVGVLMLSIRYGIFGGVELGAKRVRDSAKWYTDAVRKDYAKSFPRLLAEVAEPSRD